MLKFNYTQIYLAITLVLTSLVCFQIAPIAVLFVPCLLIGLVALITYIDSVNLSSSQHNQFTAQVTALQSQLQDEVDKFNKANVAIAQLVVQVNNLTLAGAVRPNKNPLNQNR